MSFWKIFNRKKQVRDESMCIITIPFEELCVGSICMNNTNLKNIFMQNAINNDCTVVRYYWRSIMDYKHIEYVEPKIEDAYMFICDIQGTRQNIQKVFGDMYLLKNKINSLEKLYIDNK